MIVTDGVPDTIEVETPCDGEDEAGALVIEEPDEDALEVAVWLPLLTMSVEVGTQAYGSLEVELADEADDAAEPELEADPVSPEAVPLPAALEEVGSADEPTLVIVAVEAALSLPACTPDVAVELPLGVGTATVDEVTPETIELPVDGIAPESVALDPVGKAEDAEPLPLGLTVADPDPETCGPGVAIGPLEMAPDPLDNGAEAEADPASVSVAMLEAIEPDESGGGEPVGSLTEVTVEAAGTSETVALPLVAIGMGAGISVELPLAAGGRGGGRTVEVAVAVVSTTVLEIGKGIGIAAVALARTLEICSNGS